MNYTYGLSVLHTHLYMGATLLLTDKSVLSPEFWAFFEREKGTSFAGVPFTYEYLYKLGVFHKKYKSLRVLTQAGGKLSVMLQEYYGRLAEENGFQFFIMYGQTEATARMSVLPCDMILSRLGSAGLPVPGGRFKIVEGEVVYYGDNVFMGYAEGAFSLSLGDINRGILFTGDLGYIEDGFLYITGRKDRYVKINGVRVLLPELEQWLQERYGYAIFCIYKYNDLYLVHEEKISEDEWEEISVLLRKRVPVLSDHLKHLLIKQIPKTSTGKIDFSRIEQLIRTR